MSLIQDNPFGAHQILQLLPHKCPFVFIDQVRSLDLDNKTILCEKLVSLSEPSLQGHFPGDPIFPGVLIIEALAQASGILTGCLEHGIHGDVEDFDSLLSTFQKAKLYLVESNVRNHRKVVPGCVLLLKAKVSRQKENVYRFEVEAQVDFETAARGFIMLALDR